MLQGQGNPKVARRLRQLSTARPTVTLGTALGAHRCWVPLQGQESPAGIGQPEPILGLESGGRDVPPSSLWPLWSPAVPDSTLPLTLAFRSQPGPVQGSH